MESALRFFKREREAVPISTSLLIVSAMSPEGVGKGQGNPGGGSLGRISCKEEVERGGHTNGRKLYGRQQRVFHKLKL
jgi:hypothetical protein